MIADVLQQYVGYPVSLFAVEGDEKGFCERTFQEGFDAGEFFRRKGVRDSSVGAKPSVCEYSRRKRRW